MVPHYWCLTPNHSLPKFGMRCPELSCCVCSTPGRPWERPCGVPCWPSWTERGSGCWEGEPRRDSARDSRQCVTSLAFRRARLDVKQERQGCHPGCTRSALETFPPVAARQRPTGLLHSVPTTSLRTDLRPWLVDDGLCRHEHALCPCMCTDADFSAHVG